MSGVLAAEAAILAHFQTIGVVLLVLRGVVVALLALGAGEGDLDSLAIFHNGTSIGLPEAGYL